VPRAESIETRKKMWEESRKPNTEKNLRTAIQRWNEFVATGSGDGQPYDDVEIERFLNDDGTIRPQVATTGTAFANFLYERNGTIRLSFEDSKTGACKHWHLSLFILHVPITHYILNHQLPCVIIIVIVTCALFILQEEKQQR
jgi:hypothetical protein